MGSGCPWRECLRGLPQARSQTAGGRPRAPAARAAGRCPARPGSCWPGQQLQRLRRGALHPELPTQGRPCRGTEGFGGCGNALPLASGSWSSLDVGQERDLGQVSPGLWAPRAHITGTDPVCSDAGCSNRVRDAGPGSGTSCQATSSPERRFVPTSFHGQTGTLSPSSPGPWSQGVGTWPGLSRPRGWQREGLSLDCSAALSALGLSRGIGHVGVSLPQPWGVLWHL